MVVASDVDRSGGTGPEGAGGAVLMAMGGRRGVAEELTGPGAQRLVERLGRWSSFVGTSHLLRRAGTAAVLVVVGAGCASDPAGDAGGLGSAAAAVACSDHVFWATVERTALEDDGLHVTFHVEEWVQPASGDARITLIADDPATHVGAPDWDTSERVLVMDGTDSPLDRVPGEVAEEMVAQWERSSPAPCPEGH